MKLRNKKTGKIVEREEFILIKHIDGDGSWQDGSYHSLAELNEEWEDYKPVEPLIEDEKARKVFREWADLFGAKRFRVDHLCSFCRTVITSNDLVEEPAIELPGFIGKDSETYTKVELCGDEEE